MGRVNAMTSGPFRLIAGLVAGLLALVLLAACGGDDDGGGGGGAETDDSTDETSQAVGPGDYLEVPESVELTEPGAELKLKGSAVLAWQPRQKEVAVAEVRVQRIERTTFADTFAGYTITDEMSAMTPYFVRARVANPLKANLSQLPVPLYLQDDTGMLIGANTMVGKFPHCPSSVLPKRFKKGSKANLCFVYFVGHGRKAEKVVFQYPGGLPPVTWTGKIRAYKPPAEKTDAAE